MGRNPKSFTFRFTALLIVISATISVKVHAETNDLLVRINATQLDYKTTLALAQVSPPVKVQVLASQKLGDVIQQHCGRRDENFLKVLQDRASQFPTLEQPLSFDSTITKDGELEFPFCLAIPAQQPAPSSRAPTAWISYVPTSHDFYVRSSHEKIPYKTSLAYDNIKSDDNIKWGEDLSRPASSATEFEGWSPVPLPPGANKSEAIKEVLAALPPVPATTEAEPGTAAPRQPEVAFRQSDIQILSVLEATEDKCPDRQMPGDKYPIDVISLMRVLGFNQARGMRWTEPAEVLVADTGLSDITAGTIESALAKSGWAAPEARRPTEDFPKWRHGAYVTSAVMGGAYFRRFIDLLNSPIRIRPINLISNKDGKIDSYHLASVIDNGQLRNSIINLSILTSQEISGLQAVLKGQRNALFVAAAGNAPEQISDEYPAALGGNYENLIVVGSLDQNGEFAKQSSWSQAHVELAAYGCRIPVLEEGSEKAIVFKSGTSMAAPLVSFTASMLQGYNIGGPYDLKKRLLASADYDPRLNGKVKRNLRLNPVRALAVSNDVVETDEIGSAPIFGTILKGDRLLLLCSGSDSKGRGPDAGGLVSLDVFEDENHAKNVFYLYQPKLTRDLESGTCKLDDALASHEITIEEQDSGVQRTIKVGNLRKLLFSFQR